MEILSSQTPVFNEMPCEGAFQIYFGGEAHSYLEFNTRVGSLLENAIRWAYSHAIPTWRNHTLCCYCLAAPCLVLCHVQSLPLLQIAY